MNSKSLIAGWLLASILIGLPGCARPVPFKTAYAQKEADAELKKLGSGHPWAGRFSYSTGYTSQTLVMAPRAGFVLRWSCCVGSGAAFGTVEMSGSLIKLRLQRWQDSKASQSTKEEPRVFVPVRWGKRLYMIPPSSLDKLEYAIKHGEEPRSREKGFDFLLRDGDWKIPVDGRPDIPEVSKGGS